MLRHLAALTLLAALAAPAAADVLILKDGRKLSGRVLTTDSGYEITIEGQKLSFSHDDVSRHVTSPKELLGNSDQLIEEAKQLFLEAAELKDMTAKGRKLASALDRVRMARTSYADTRDLFPDGYPELDKQLMLIMRLMRMIRDQLGATPIKPNPEPVTPKIDRDLTLLADHLTPTAPPPPSAPVTPVSLLDAMPILADPNLRTDKAKRRNAMDIFRRAWGTPGAGSDLAAAAALFLWHKDAHWGFSVMKETPASQQFQYFLLMLGEDPTELNDDDLIQLANFLASSSKKLKASKPPANVAAFDLFACAVASSLIARQGGREIPELEAVFKAMGLRKADMGSIWGTTETLAIDDFRKWVASRDYTLAVVQFRNDYRNVVDFHVQYAYGLLLTFKALSDKRSYRQAVSHFQRLSKTSQGAQHREHLLALARSIYESSPCRACGGSHQINCSACKGKRVLTLQCRKCGGAGRVTGFGGNAACSACSGQGRFVDVECPKCKGSGKVECRARGCKLTSADPTLADFAKTEPCVFCRKRVTLMRYVAYPCPACNGIGFRVKPTSDPKQVLK